jgi:hypothetical protein
VAELLDPVFDDVGAMDRAPVEETGADVIQLAPTTSRHVERPLASAVMSVLGMHITVLVTLL